MRDFTWEVFRQTGDIEAYLLYRGLDELHASAGAAATEDEAEAPPAAVFVDGPVTLL